jgi:SAM-dependent methyltransferase
MKKHDYHKEIIDKQYDELAPNYENLYLRAGWNDPEECAKLARDTEESLPDELRNVGKENIEILDMGCGSGLVGKYLYEYGFRKIVGVDCSQGMLDEVNKNRPEVHSELKLLFLGKPESYPEELKNRFHFITASGILADNHLDCSVFEEMLLSLRVGGIACFATRTEYLEKYQYGAYMKQLVDDGRWKFVKEVTFGRYD